MEATMLPAGRKAADDWVHENATALLAAVYFYVTMRAKCIASGVEVDREEYVPLRKEIIAQLSRARNEVEVKGQDDEHGWAGWSTVKPREFDDAVEQATQKEWLDGDWYQAIADVLQSREGADVDMLDGADEADFSKSGQVTRADTMFQDKFDYLSDARRADYKVWRETMLKRISHSMASGGAMEVDPA